MKITWLGQAGVMICTGGTTILVDPYLSNSVAKINPACERRVPVDERFLQIKPDVLVFTHNHLDHFDPETAEHYLKDDSGVTVLSPISVWEEARRYGGSNNYVMFGRHTQWTHAGVRFTAVKAVHSDREGIGVLVEAEGKTIYCTGDTLYSTDILPDIPSGVDCVFLPVNGVGNNMNMADGARFVKDIQAKCAVPVHVGLFDSLDPHDFPCECKRVLRMYEEEAF